MFHYLLFLSSLFFTGAALSVAYQIFPPLGSFSNLWSNLLFGGLSGALLAAAILFIWKRLAPSFEEEGVEQRLLNSLWVGLGGTAVGIVVACGVALAFPQSAGVRIAQGVLLVSSSLTGIRIGFLLHSPISRPRQESGNTRARRVSNAPKKILDTSIIIDGRIGSLLATGFVEGEILVPEFVLGELQNIADSSNSLRRRKGRRGLDALNQLMQDENVNIRITSRDYPSIREVDRKLIHLAKDESAVLITTDYNLNRVAQVEGVAILNVNELSNAVKPRFIPGEDISVEIIDRGEEINQGVGYLDDGTMVVVENGRRHIGRTINAVVKSTLQTDAGRMLFVEPAAEQAREEQQGQTHD
ncbi:PIN domain nuclease [Candidatus Bipolaricaulota bacterium]|nr:PIN domain nuclease [Candidatus Bipolaricaulota bacterium]